VLLWERGHLDRAVLYAVGSVLVSLVALRVGLTLVRRVM
jgi:hypothetical protein